ncbi:MAG: hypothetical protein GY820_25910 [Gammaproteobacteria bacterium]|nr:hypothetical protein [Gammaproteobacteria bacterium]
MTERWRTALWVAGSTKASSDVALKYPRYAHKIQSTAKGGNKAIFRFESDLMTRCPVSRLEGQRLLPFRPRPRSAAEFSLTEKTHWEKRKKNSRKKWVVPLPW